jgi:hypothetical protein
VDAKKSAIGILLALLIVVGVGFATTMIISPSSGNNNKAASPTPEPQPIQMRIISSTSVWQSGDNYEVRVALENLPGKKITAATTHLTYDPRLLQVSDIKNGKLWTTPEVLVNSVDNEEGELIYSIVPGGSADFTGESSVAIITFTPINQLLGYTTISLGNRSALASPGLDAVTPSFAAPLTVTLKPN